MDFTIKQTEKLMPKLAHTTVIRFFGKLRSIMNDVVTPIKMSSCVEGRHEVIEIDESLFGKRHKYHKGRPTERIWIFGMVQRKTRTTYFTPVKDRTSETLCEIIRNKVEIGAKVFHDDWAAYNKLSEYGYEHDVVVHTREFVSASGVCTNTIEGIKI